MRAIGGPADGQDLKDAPSMRMQVAFMDEENVGTAEYHRVDDTWVFQGVLWKQNAEEWGWQQTMHTLEYIFRDV
jgi:hypothetical protein